jgi:hypothetical protein
MELAVTRVMVSFAVCSDGRTLHQHEDFGISLSCLRLVNFHPTELLTGRMDLTARSVVLLGAATTSTLVRCHSSTDLPKTVTELDIFGYIESLPLGKRGWVWKSEAVQPKNVPGIQNDSFLSFVQFVPAKIHHGYVAQMEV